MIYLITGVPGSGKTLYAVSTLVQQLMKDAPVGKDGKKIERRLCIDGIPNLLLPHELMASPPEADIVSKLKGKEAAEVEPEGDGLWNWYEWCKPGDLIVVDEVQRYWRPRGMGTKPPKEIMMLETHRHFGVDFVVITQNPMLIDQNVRRLIGRHQHVRRILGMQRAMVYDWDGCQADTSRVSTATARTMFGYPKSAYALYKSSELHTKQKQKVPAWVLLPIIALVGGIAVAPQAYSVMTKSISGKGITAAAPGPGATASTPVAAASVPVEPVPLLPPSNISVGLLPGSNAPKDPEQEIAGCVVHRGECSCFNGQGKKVDGAKPEMCLSGVPAKTAEYLSSVPLVATYEQSRNADPGEVQQTGDLIAASRAWSNEQNRVGPRFAPYAQTFRF